MSFAANRPESTELPRKQHGGQETTLLGIIANPLHHDALTGGDGFRQPSANKLNGRGIMTQLTGIHHLTAVTADAAGNHDFYTRTLGMRLVKKTVNQDDTGAYHLFYADGQATPGTDLTFFDWPVGRERRGTHGIVCTALRVRPGALDF